MTLQKKVVHFVFGENIKENPNPKTMDNVNFINKTVHNIIVYMHKFHIHVLVCAHSQSSICIQSQCLISRMFAASYM